MRHPYVLPGFADCFTWSLPILLENIVNVLQQLVVGMIEEGSTHPDQLSPEERRADEALASKTKELYSRYEKIREKQSVIQHMKDEDYHKNMSLFEQMLKKDRASEACPEDVTPKSPTNPRVLRRSTSGKW